MVRLMKLQALSCEGAISASTHIRAGTQSSHTKCISRVTHIDFALDIIKATAVHECNRLTGKQCHHFESSFAIEPLDPTLPVLCLPIGR